MADKEPPHNEADRDLEEKMELQMPYLPKTASFGERLVIAALTLPLAVLGSAFLLYIVGVSQA